MNPKQIHRMAAMAAHWFRRGVGGVAQYDVALVAAKLWFAERCCAEHVGEVIYENLIDNQSDLIPGSGQHGENKGNSL